MLQQVVRKSQVHNAIVTACVAVPGLGLLIFMSLSRAGDWVCCGVSALLVGFFPLVMLGTVFWPHLHPLMQMLKPFGDVRDVARKIDAELDDADQTVLVGPDLRWDGWKRWHARVAVSRHWAINLSPAAGAAVFLPDVVWVYKQLTVVGGLARGKVAPGVGCHRRDGGHVWFRTETEDDAEDVLEAILERHPEVLTGFRGEWIDLAKAHAMAQADEVERRRAAVARLTPEERDQWIDDRLAELNAAVRRLESAIQATRMV